TVRRDLQLEYSEGGDCLPNATIFEQLTLMGKPKRKDTQLPQSSGPNEHVADEAVNEDMDDSLERAATTATSLDAEQDRGNINKTKSKETPNEAGSQGTTLGGGPKGNTLRSGEDNFKLNGLMELCTNLQQRVLDLETTKTTQANEIARLKGRVVKLERMNKSITHRLKRMYIVGLIARVKSSGDEDLGKDASKQGRRINAINADEDITLVNDQDDADMFDVNDLYGDEVVVDNVDVVKTAKETTTTATITDVEDKDKGIMIEEPVVDQVKPMKRLEQIRLDEELAFKLQAEEEEEEERLSREKAHQTKEANKAWDDIQAKIKADYYKEENILQLREHKRRGTDHQQELNKGVSYELEQVNAKKQKVDEDKETAELQRLIEVIPDEEEVAIDAVPLATKPPTIVNWKIHKEGKKSYYQIIRADGKSQMYRVFSQMLKSFSRENLEDLYKLVKAKYRLTRLVEDLDLIL
ncbi:hypothetical protein Tco_1051295, partial [Tanacetum coccineum]